TQLTSTIVDAGGSGTRLIVYQYTDTLEEHKVECESIGLGNWKEEDYPELEQQLNECYKKGHQYLPDGSTNTPIWFGATAGMRLLKLRDRARYDKIWTLVKKTLNATDYDNKWSDVFPGEYEARFSWITSNILSKGFVNKKTVGMVETGSSSIQIAFAVNESADTNKHIDAIKIKGHTVNLYEYSYLCYGEAEGLRRVHAELIKAAGFSNEASDPCSNIGYNWTRSSDFLWSVPCVKGDFATTMFGSSIEDPQGNVNKTYTLSGSSEPDKCMELIKKMIPTECTTNTPCGMDDVSQPKVNGKYLALASFYYSTDYMGLPYNGKKEEYWNKTVELCKTPYSEIPSKYEDEPEKFMNKQCFDSIFSYFLLSEGYKFDEDNWDVEYVHKINGKSVEWTLGAAFSFMDEAFKTEIDVVQPQYRAMLIVGIVLLVLAAVFIVVGIVGLTKSRQYESI
uniref:Ectonucleoside triphosphate diphosphohydrolase n=1 Tax=Clytia hemisphaerica TaxID=252671 RepID=A0A7M5WV36_9CNID